MCKLNYRSLSKESDWPFFDIEFKLSPSTAAMIHPLTERSSAELWSKYISSAPSERHLMLLPAGHWIKSDLKGPNWLSEYNSTSENYENIQSQSVSDFIDASFDVSDSEEVFFFLMREAVYALPFCVFSTHWQAFLALDDEGPILFHPTSGSYVYFGPNGQVFSGKRKVV